MDVNEIGMKVVVAMMMMMMMMMMMIIMMIMKMMKMMMMMMMMIMMYGLLYSQWPTPDVCVLGRHDVHHY